MNPQTIQIIGLMLSAMIFIMAHKMPVPALFLVGMWAVVLMFDCADNRGRHERN